MLHSDDDEVFSFDFWTEGQYVLGLFMRGWGLRCLQEIDMLIERGVCCYPLDYLSTYLMEEDLHPEKFLHKDYAARLQAKKAIEKSLLVRGP